MKELQEKIEALTYADFLQHGKGTPSEFVWEIFESGIKDQDNVPQSLLDAVSDKETELEGIHESQGLVYENYYEEYGVSERDFY